MMSVCCGPKRLANKSIGGGEKGGEGGGEGGGGDGGGDEAAGSEAVARRGGSEAARVGAGLAVDSRRWTWRRRRGRQLGGGDGGGGLAADLAEAGWEEDLAEADSVVDLAEADLVADVVEAGLADERQSRHGTRRCKFRPLCARRCLHCMLGCGALRLAAPAVAANASTVGNRRSPILVGLRAAKVECDFLKGWLPDGKRICG